MRGKRTTQALALLLGAIVAGGCTFTWPVGVNVSTRETIEGSGNVVTEEREVSGFSRISLTGAGVIVITQGDEESLTVETDDNLMPYIETRVSGSTLVLEFSEEARNLNVHPSSGITFDLHLVEIEDIELTGAGDVEASSIEAGRLEIDVTGAGDVRIDALAADELVVRLAGVSDFDLAGQVREQDVTITGTGNYRAGDLRSEIVDLSIPGAGDATVWATDELDVTISGMGNVSYHGRPTVSQHITGIGKLISLGEREE